MLLTLSDWDQTHGWSIWLDFNKPRISASGNWYSMNGVLLWTIAAFDLPQDFLLDSKLLATEFDHIPLSQSIFLHCWGVTLSGMLFTTSHMLFSNTSPCSSILMELIANPRNFGFLITSNFSPGAKVLIYITDNLQSPTTVPRKEPAKREWSFSIWLRIRIT